MDRPMEVVFGATSVHGDSTSTVTLTEGAVRALLEHLDALLSVEEQHRLAHAWLGLVRAPEAASAPPSTGQTALLEAMRDEMRALRTATEAVLAILRRRR